MRALYKIAYYVLIVGLCLTGPALLWAWKQWVEPRWGTKQVVMAVQTVERGETITAQHVRLSRIPKEAVVEGALVRLEDAIGKESIRTLRSREQVTPEAIDTDGLVPGPGEWNMPLPAEWIFGKPPGSLLRGDRVTLLPVPKEQQTVQTAAAAEQQSDEWTREKLEALNISYEDEQRLTGMAVSYAKGANNQEIAGGEDRKTPTGTVAAVELIVTDEQKELIRKYGTQGYRFLIIYR